MSSFTINSLVSLAFASIMAGTSYFTIGIAGATMIGFICFGLMLSLTTLSRFSGISVGKMTGIQETKKQHKLMAVSQLHFE